VAGAEILSKVSAREVLQVISQARFARERDMLAGRLKKHDDLKALLGELKRTNLVNTEHLLECKRTGTPLTRLDDPNLLKEAVGALTCPSCGARFRDEALSEGYSLSELGHKLLLNSRWMTVWITEMLVGLGVQVEFVLWNVSEHGDEVDIIVEFLGNIWILELKDREFGAGDAHPLNYRRARYKAQKAIIVTTDKVSRDAKRVFEDLFKGEGKKAETGLIYVEGLDAAREVLGREIVLAEYFYAAARLRSLEGVSGYDLSRVVGTRYGFRFQG
jgi:hypothetical protein